MTRRDRISPLHRYESPSYPAHDCEWLRRQIGPGGGGGGVSRPSESPGAAAALARSGAFYRAFVRHARGAHGAAIGARAQLKLVTDLRGPQTWCVAPRACV